MDKKKSVISIKVFELSRGWLVSVVNKGNISRKNSNLKKRLKNQLKLELIGQRLLSNNSVKIL